jgi:polyhydroxyalkanoate synthesis regulator phasin
VKQKLSSAYCNLAELYLTDLCEEETAENDCEQYLEKALQLKDGDGEPPVDALQTMANLRLSQQERQLEAVPFILRSYEKQRVGSEALATLVGLHHGGTEDDYNNKMKEEDGQSRELVEVEAANNLPEFEFRCQTAKLLLECAGVLKDSRKTTSSTSGTNQKEDECITAAICVLGSLLAQNDEVVEIWFLTGCAFAGKIPPLVDEAKFYLERAKEMLTDIQKALKEESQYVCDSERQDLEEQLEKNATQMQDVQSKLDELPAELEEEVDTTNDKLMMEEG